jgi:hypothetical protein
MSWSGSLRARLSGSTAGRVKPSILRALPWIILAACAGAPKPESKPASPPPASAATAELASPPFTAEQIRDATRPGRTYEFKLEVAGQPAQIHRITFVEVTPESATAEALDLDAQGQPLGGPERGTSTWAELVGHAAYPRAATVISEESIAVPAGEFACTLYTVVEGPQRKRVYFAKNLPGAPVLMVVEQDGQVVQTLTLLKHTPGS